MAPPFRLSIDSTTVYIRLTKTKHSTSQTNKQTHKHRDKSVRQHNFVFTELNLTSMCRSRDLTSKVRLWLVRLGTWQVRFDCDQQDLGLSKTVRLWLVGLTTASRVKVPLRLVDLRTQKKERFDCGQQDKTRRVRLWLVGLGTSVARGLGCTQNGLSYLHFKKNQQQVE